MSKEFRNMNPDSINITFTPAPRTDKVVAYTLQPGDTLEELERGEFISLKPTTHKGEVGIDGGWDAERATFVIECMTVPSIVTTKVIRIYGYTSPLENGQITDDTRLFFNRYIRYASSPQRSPTGLVNCVMMQNDLHILIQPNANTNYTLRPNDILRRKIAELAFADYAQGTSIHTLTNLTSSFVDSRPRTADVGSEDPATYMTSIKKAETENRTGEGDELETTLSFISCSVEPTSIGRLPFFNKLCMDTNYGMVNSITWGELKVTFDLDPVHIDLTAQTVVEAGGWDNSVESWMANLIINRVSAAMGRCGLEKASTQGDPNDALAWDTTQFVPESVVCKQGIEEDGEVEFTGMGVLPYPYSESDIRVDISIDISSWANVTVSIDGMAPRTFTKPMYASAVSSALITEEERILDSLADGVTRTINH